MKSNQKIVVLDGYTLNPGDQSWKDLESLGECTIFDRTHYGEVLQRARGAEILLTNKTVLDRRIIESLPNLTYIGVMATGYNVVDIEAARNDVFLCLMYQNMLRNLLHRWYSLYCWK